MPSVRRSPNCDNAHLAPAYRSRVWRVAGRESNARRCPPLLVFCVCLSGRFALAGGAQSRLVHPVPDRVRIALRAERSKVAFPLIRVGLDGRADRAAIESTLSGIFDSKFAGAMEKQSQTFDGMISNLMDQWTRFQQMVMASGVFDWMKERLGGLLDTLNRMAADGSLQEIADAFGQRIIRVFEAVEAAAKYVLPTTVALGGALSPPSRNGAAQTRARRCAVRCLSRWHRGSAVSVCWRVASLRFAPRKTAINRNFPLIATNPSATNHSGGGLSGGHQSGVYSGSVQGRSMRQEDRRSIHNSRLARIASSVPPCAAAPARLVVSRGSAARSYISS